MSTFGKSTKLYNSLIYDNGPVKLTDYISDKYNKIHDKLYKKALKLYFLLNKEEDIKNYRYYELPSDEYYMPSRVIFISKKYPYTKKIVDLTMYWDYFEYNRQKGKNYTQIKFSEENIPDMEVIYMDYARGIATLYSKVEDMYLEVDFDVLTADTPVSSEYNLTNTFTHMLNGK